MNIGEARNVNKLILWATEGHRAPGMGWQVPSHEVITAAKELADRTYKTLLQTGQGCGLRGEHIHSLRETTGAFDSFVRLILEYAPVSWVSSKAGPAVAIDYVRALEEVAKRHLGHLPAPAGSEVSADG